MFNKIDDLIRNLEFSAMGSKPDPTQIQALAALYLAKEVSNLRATLERVTAASDAIPGGYALKVVSVK